MNEELAFWIDLIASSTAILGLFFVAYELSRARKAEVRQFHFETFMLFSIDMRQDRIIEGQMRLEKHENLVKKAIRDPEAFHAFKNVLDFYTLIATAARDKTINRDKALDYWGQPIISYWSAYGQLFIENRQLFGSGAGQDLEWFYKEAVIKHQDFADRIVRIRDTVRDDIG